MQTLFTIDNHDYDPGMRVEERLAVRAVIIRDGKLAVQKGSRGDYKILGGGMDAGETKEHALMREVREEAGLLVVPESIREVGEIIEKHRDLFADDVVFLRRCKFFLCDVEDQMVECAMTKSEIEGGYRLVWETPQKIIAANQPYMEESWIYRDTEFVRMLSEGRIKGALL